MYARALMGVIGQYNHLLFDWNRHLFIIPIINADFCHADFCHFRHILLPLYVIGKYLPITTFNTRINQKIKTNITLYDLHYMTYINSCKSFTFHQIIWITYSFIIVLWYLVLLNHPANACLVYISLITQKFHLSITIFL